IMDKIIIKGAREHNLKNINLEIPRDKFIVFTGLSGSGKSTLAFDTIYAEGQRRYLESLSSYARQFLEQMVEKVLDLADQKIEILAPVVRGRKGEYIQLLNDLCKQGYSSARINGKEEDLSKKINL